MSILLSTLAFVAATALAGRANMAGRAERLLAATVLWLVLTQVPTYALAWANWLSPTLLAASVMVLSIAGLVVSGRKRSPREHMLTVGHDLWDLIRMPWDAFVLLASARSFVLLGALFCALMIAWSGVISFLAPPEDGLPYHDAIVGFAMQNHGFSLVDAGETLSIINTAPRVCETISLFFVAFGDRRLLEFPSVLFAIPLLVGVYALTKRYVDDASYAIGCACVVLLMPCTYLLLRSTDGDVVATALFVVALYFATRPVFRLRDAWMSATMLGLLLGAKLMAVGIVPPIGVVLAIRVLWHHGRRRRAASVATLLGGAAWLLLLGAPTYLRNWALHGNPLWPWAMDIGFLRIHWPGQPRPAAPSLPEVTSILELLLGTPVPGIAWPNTQQHGYGVGVVVLMVPLAGLALLVAFVRFALRRLHEPMVSHRDWNLLYSVAPAFAWIPLSPDLLVARHNVHLAIVLVVATAGLLARGRCWRMREVVVSASIAVALILFYWAFPRYGSPLATAREFWRLTTAERAGARVLDLSPTAHVVDSRVVTARENELRAGDIAAYGDGVLVPSILWNERYSNRVARISSASGPDVMLQQADQMGAKWLVVSSAMPELTVVRARSTVWQEVGPLSTTPPAVIAFRRVESLPVQP